jgi:sulfite exporter TauE/SafE
MNSIMLYGFIIGLTSNLHCIGMCGPIALAVPVKRHSMWSIFSGVLQYNFGRVITYSLLGILIGMIGISASTFGILQWLSIVTGLFLILYAWRKWIGSRIEQSLAIPALNSFVSKNIGKLMRTDIPGKLLFLGGLNGLLPCGMVFLALGNALLAGSPVNSALAMAAFGIGTLPSMIAVGFAANRFTMEWRNKMNKLVPYMLTVVGILIVLRGMNLNIPFISPQVKTVPTEQQTEEVEMSCCSSKKQCDKTE